MQRWEYRVEEVAYGLNQGQLGSWGEGGWELVSEVMIRKANNVPMIRSVFKRAHDSQ